MFLIESSTAGKTISKLFSHLQARFITKALSISRVTLVYNNLEIQVGHATLGYHGSMIVKKEFMETLHTVSKYTEFEPELSVIADRTILI